ncbi:LysR family transcriptional regulator [Pigmentiphaga soli]
MRLTLRQLQIFVAVCETGGTLAAARRVSMSQSAASAALNDLENLLGTRLFDRIGKRLALNESGRLLLPQAQALLDGALGIERQFSIGAAGTAQLRVGASTTIGNYVMPPLIADFRKQLPQARIELLIGNTSDVVAQVSGFKVDIGFIEGNCHDVELEATPWLPDELVIVCSPAHPLASRQRGRRLGPGDLRAAEWLLREPGSGTREISDQMLLPHLHRFDAAMVLGNAEAIKRAAAEGLGLGCLSRWVVADMLADGRLAPLRTSLPPLVRHFYLIRHKRKVPSAGLARFIAHCQAATPAPGRGQAPADQATSGNG